ncbi:unnamed protein product [Ceutorhynchus assimilis]|uniref:DNA polymerase n=1 Tax=Ceutorhynchus assimilis TaxID=467358 RepID=A0A9N9MKE4_9CUCU|nr:unnamed protein product [Ceutorhynchus assimilis]
MDDDSEARKPKRQKTSYKAKAFEKFKQLKSGGRNKYEIEEVDNLYEVVDEREYAKKVLDRQDDDWIVDDDGSGYVEDGRDIFDDDLDAESINQAKSKNKGVKRKKAVSDNAPKGNLKYMLSNITSKKKEETQIEDDNMLSEILGEIDASPSTSKKDSKPFVPKSQLAQNYLKKFSIDKKTKAEKPPIDTVMDEEIVEIPLKNVDSEKDELLSNSKQATKIIPQKQKEEVSESHQNEDFHDAEDVFADDLDLVQMDAIESKITESETAAEPKNDSFDLAAMFTQSSGFNESLEEEEICTPSVSDDEAFRFFWWDAFEDAEKQKGKVFLFGKTYCRKSKSYLSCCVAVENLSSQVFVLPRPFMLDDSGKPTEKPVTYQELYKEFTSLVADKMNIQNYKARLCQKKYAFDPTVPAESDYMEVRFPANGPRIFPESIKGCPKTFSKIFGAFSSTLERFLLEAKLKGPCWLDIKNPIFNNHPMTWCKIEVKCASIRDVVKVAENLPPPPLTVATINFRHHINLGTNQQEILMVSCVTQTSYAVDKKAPRQVFDQHFCVFTGPSKQPLPLNIHAQLQNYKGTRVQKMDSEKALLNYFIIQFAKIDPDLIVGHDLVGLQIDILANRLIKRDVSTFSKLSRVKRAEKGRLVQDLFTGRLVADLKISAKELIKSRTYDLPTLCQQVLKLREDQITDLEPDEVVRMYENTEDIFKLIEYTMQDTAYMLKILYDLNIIPLALQITNIAGNIMSKTLMGGRSERNEYLLMHAFQEKDYIVPEKKFKRRRNNNDSQQVAKKKPAYAGGLVLEPKIGFYDKLLLLMDFNSLYPSIIQEYNICFTTLPTTDEDNNLVLPDKNLPPGILPVEIKKLVDSRKQVKKLMATPDLSPDMWMQYNIRQMALKLTANSMYGCLGFANSRFYAKNLAALVTQKGREILTNTKDLVEKMMFEVVYGDTDSIMINTNLLDYDQVLKIGNKIKQEVNKYYKMVELDVDGIFKYLLLLKKKKYAAVTLKRTNDGQLQEEKEYKGLDIVRRDWSRISSEAGKQVLEYILSDQTEDERLINIQNYLRKLREDLEEGRMPIQLLEITKQLAKDPKEYPNKDNFAHVLVALRYNQEHRGHLRVGDAVCYVICEDGTNNSATKRGYHPEELKIKEHLKIDVKYYLSQQIHPVVARLIDPLEGIDADVIAECLGLDGTVYKKAVAKKPQDVGENIMLPEVKFRNCVKFTFKCLVCQEENIVNGPLNEDKVPFLTKCSNPDCTAKPIDYLYHIQNQLCFKINEFIRKYYNNKLICEDPSCTTETNKLPIKFMSKYPVCQGCQQGVLYRDYTEAELATQLEYFVYIFNLANLNKKPLLEDSIERGYHQLVETVSSYVKRSAYSVVNLKEVFEILEKIGSEKCIR